MRVSWVFDRAQGEIKLCWMVCEVNEFEILRYHLVWFFVINMVECIYYTDI